MDSPGPELAFGLPTCGYIPVDRHCRQDDERTTHRRRATHHFFECDSSKQGAVATSSWLLLPFFPFLGVRAQFKTVEKAASEDSITIRETWDISAPSPSSNTACKEKQIHGFHLRGTSLMHMPASGNRGQPFTIRKIPHDRLKDTECTSVCCFTIYHQFVKACSSQVKASNANPPTTLNVYRNSYHPTLRVRDLHLPMLDSASLQTFRTAPDRTSSNVRDTFTKLCGIEILVATECSLDHVTRDVPKPVESVERAAVIAVQSAEEKSRVAASYASAYPQAQVSLNVPLFCITCKLPCGKIVMRIGIMSTFTMRTPFSLIIQLVVFPVMPITALCARW